MGYSRTGALRRQTAGQQDFAVYDFSGGLNVKSAPQELADNDLTQALNGYLRPDGGFESRRGLRLYNSLNINSPVIGLFRFSQFVKGGVQTSVTQTLAQCNDAVYDLDTKQQLGTLGKGSFPWSITGASDAQADPNEMAAPGLTEVAVIAEGAGGPYVYDGNTIYHPIKWENAKGARYCALVNGVVWFGGIKKYPTQVMSTGSGQVAGDSFEGIAGYSVFDFGRPVTGLSVLGSGAQAMLVVGLPNGFALIYGTGPANYTQQFVPMDNDGVASGYTMIVNNGVLYFLGNNNAYAFNPLTMPNPQPISLKVQPWITNDSFVTGFPMQGSRNKFFAWMYYDRFQIAYSSANANQFDTILVYDTNIQGWTVLDLGVQITSATLINSPGDPSPSASLVGGVGGNVYTWDPYVGQQNSQWNACDWNQAIWDDTTMNSDNGSNISVWVATKFFKLGEPGSVKTLHRIYPEIIYPISFGGTATAQTDYGLESSFTSNILAVQAGGATWDVSLWDNAFWSASPTVRSSWNAPASRIDVNSQLPNSIDNFMIWNVTDWNAGPWGSFPLPPIIAPGIQGEAFSLGMQSGIGTGGAIWDQSLWDAATWSVTDQLPWVLSGWTGSFAQNAKR